MTAKAKKPLAVSSVLELNTGSYALPTLKLIDTDMDSVVKELAGIIGKAPETYTNTVVIIDLSHLANTQVTVNFPLLVGLMRGYNIVPIGVQGGNESQNQMAELMELMILDHGTKSDAVSQKAKQALHESWSTKMTHRVISKPVRSGQKIYAPGGDAIILGAINSGGEVIAAGNIHVYGPLRGRAHAGVKGNRAARIFCVDTQAEMASVAGRYRVNVSPKENDGKGPLQIYLKKNKLIVSSV